MKSKDLFKLAVRLLGLVFLYHGLQILPAAIGQMINSFPHELGMGVKMKMNFLAFLMGIFAVAWPLALAYWLGRGAPRLIRIAYPEGTKEDAQIGGTVN